jgi:hypothetical protein
MGAQGLPVSARLGVRRALGAGKMVRIYEASSIIHDYRRSPMLASLSTTRGACELQDLTSSPSIVYSGTVTLARDFKSSES